jgi:hypothetical protein
MLPPKACRYPDLLRSYEKRTQVVVNSQEEEQPEEKSLYTLKKESADPEAIVEAVANKVLYDGLGRVVSIACGSSAFD